jgi:VWA domain-containing protein/aerotolerance regulator-like protein
MIFATPWGLLALLAIPGIVAIHLFRRRFPVRPVAGLFLWQILRQTPEGGGRITKLPITTSLLLECLAALALALILAGARISPGSVSQHLVVLLDDSASMAAANTGGESARDRAVGRVLAEINRLPSAARVTLIQSGERPSILSGPAALALEARTALESWRPEAQHHAMSLGMRLARELAGQTGMVMVVSDAAPAPRGEPSFDNGLWVSIGEPVTNVGITAAQRTSAQDDRSGTILMTLTSNAATTVRQRLSVVAGGSEVLARDLDIPQGSSSLTLPLPAGLPAVRVALRDDGLRRDNEVMLAEPRPQTVAVETALPEGRGRTALINALNALSGVTTAESGHLAFVNAIDLDRPRTGDVWRVGFGRPPASWIAPGEPQDLIGPFVLEKRHSLLLGVTLDGVVWSGAWPLVPGAVRPVVSNGDRMLVGTPAGPTHTGTAILFNLDLDRTNLVRSPDWPILISNLVEMRRQSLPGPERWNYRSGEWIRARLDREPKAPLRYRGGGVERTLPAGRQIEFIAPSPGGLLQILEGDQVLFEIGVNFLDEVETALGNPSKADAGRLVQAAGMRAESGAASDPLFWILLVIGGIAILVNWCLFAPLAAKAANVASGPRRRRHLRVSRRAS